jgi:hypothetical protein
MRITVDPWIVIISFGIGMFIVYITQRTPKVIIKLPAPDSQEKSIFRDDVNNCYDFKIREVACTPEAVDFPIERHLELFKNETRHQFGWA